MVLRAPRAAQFSLGSPARRQLVLPSCPAQQCGWLQTAFQLGVFSSYKCFLTPCLCLPGHSAAPCTFALVYFTPEHFRGRLVGLAPKGCQGSGGAGDGEGGCGILSAQGCAVPNPAE